MKLSMVSTLFRSAATVVEFHRRASAAARQVVGEDFEMVLVNDGSPDASLDLAVELAKTDGHVVVVDLSRNFGHHQAMMTGLGLAKGERIFLIDSDLEEEPEWLSGFSAEMAGHECDVVYGVQRQRRGGLLERWSGRLFYLFFRAVTGIQLPENAVTARLMTRRYVDGLLRHEERDFLIAGLWHITGFVQRPWSVDKHSTGTSTYTVRRKLSLLVTAVTAFSDAPPKIIFCLGVAIVLVALLFLAHVLVRGRGLAGPVDHWSLAVASLWLLGGLTLASLGVVGTYVSKVLIEAKRRPSTIVRRVHARGQD